MTKRRMTAAARGLTLTALFSLLACGLVRPPLKIRHLPNGVTLDVQTLGEYMSSVSRIRISNASGRVVWDVVANAQVPQLHEVNLQCGSNPAHIPGFDELKVVVPASYSTFVLKGKESYTVEVWSPDAWFPARAEFSTCIASR